MKYKQPYLLIISLIFSLSVQASDAIKCLTENSYTSRANIGILIKNLSTGKVIESYRSGNLIPPASTMKLFTTATALEALGSDHRFETRLLYSGKISNGVLNGDLYIQGLGDPTLGSMNDNRDILGTWSAAIRKAGIQSVNGAVIGDCSYYDGDAMNPGWLWEDISNYYAPGIFAIAYMDNTCNIHLKSGPVGSVATVMSTHPVIPELQFENHIRCTQTDMDGAYVYGLPYQNWRYLTGSVPSNRGAFSIRGDIPNPSLLLAQHLTNRLRKDGVNVRDEATYLSESDRKARTLLYTHYSDTLGAIIRQTNMHSINLYAEMLFRNLASRISIPCTVHNSEIMMRNFWYHRGVDIHTMIIKDGCGLAPQNGVSPEHFINLLDYMSKSPSFPSFYNSLPVSGQSGTLKALLANTELQGRVHAKSGTIAGTRNYAGYIDMPNGERWAFAILVNSAPCKAQQIRPAIEKFLLDVYKRNK